MEQKHEWRAKVARLSYNQLVRGPIESPDQSSVALAGGPAARWFFPTSRSIMLGCLAIAALIIRAAAKL